MPAIMPDCDLRSSDIFSANHNFPLALEIRLCAYLGRHMEEFPMTRHPVLLTGIGIFAATFAAAVIVATVAGHHPMKFLAELAGMMSKAAAYGVELRK